MFIQKQKFADVIPSIVRTKEGAVFIDTAQWITNLSR